ncbi:perlucin-like protein [Pomacea canaliculata]|uniref:perlucin-like protein n=1 Tax=Pomacea canaliculata TaxID=400727 RepID=UPI000D732C10|nr:perlucin-like protein [Pomacea canaliculata]
MSGAMLRSSAVVLILMTMLGLSAAADNCPAGWRKYKHSCYVFISEFLTYAEAMRICNMLRAEIVEINSEEEHSFIGSLLDLNKGYHMWIGMNDLIQEGTWVSASSGTPVNFTKWRNGEPNDAYGKEDCADYHNDHKAWNDVTCGYKTTFVCESRYTEK